MNKNTQTGFTLIEVAMVLLIVGILLGYTVALFPRQQELKQYRAVDRQMDEVIEAVIGYAQVNGRLPCPAQPDDAGVEDATVVGGVIVGCDTYGGFVPVNTLGLDGRFNEDSLLLDPWGNPYRYYVSGPDFTGAGQMRLVGLVDKEANSPPGDGYPDLDGRYLICDDPGSDEDEDPNDQCADADNEVFGRYDATAGLANLETRYGGAPVVLLSMGKNGGEATAGDELDNSGSMTVSGTASGNDYLLKNVAAGETTFVRRRDGMADDFDDVVRWVSPGILFSRMIQAGQLP